MAEFRVVILRRAQIELDQVFDYATRRAPEAADKWLRRFQVALSTLSRNPTRCPLAHEDQRTAGYELREFLFGRRPNVFRIVFFVDGGFVRVISIRRGSRRFLSLRQIDEALDGNSWHIEPEDS